MKTINDITPLNPEQLMLASVAHFEGQSRFSWRKLLYRLRYPQWYVTWKERKTEKLIRASNGWDIEDLSYPSITIAQVLTNIIEQWRKLILPQLDWSNQEHLSEILHAEIAFRRFEKATLYGTNLTDEEWSFVYNDVLAALSNLDSIFLYFLGDNVELMYEYDDDDDFLEEE